VLQIKAKLSGGYHRDFQLLKEPLMRGLDRTRTMLDAISHAVPKIGVDRKRCEVALVGGSLSTDEVMRRVELGRPFRAAYREVAAALEKGTRFETPPPSKIISRRSATGGLGNLGLPALKARIRKSLSWNTRERRRFGGAIRKLVGTSDRRTARPPVRP
jgi:argininosuccinate lyase